MTEQCIQDTCVCQSCLWKKVCQDWLNGCFNEKECTACYALGVYRINCNIQKALMDLKSRGLNFTPIDIRGGACRFEQN